MTKGVVYFAGAPRYVDKAIQSSSGLRKTNPGLEILLLTNQKVNNPLFNKVVPIETTPYIILNKIEELMKFPYDRNLFFDADTYVGEPIEEMFQLLDHFDIAAPHAPYRIMSPVADIPESFPEYNVGVLLFKKSDRVKNFFMQWRDLYKKFLEQEFPNPDPNTQLKINDQPAFREVLYKSDLRVATLTPEYNCRCNWVGYLNGKAKILHGHSDDLEECKNALNQDLSPRVHCKVNGKVEIITREIKNSWGPITRT